MIPFLRTSLVAFIPNFRTFRQGIIRNVLLDFSINEILNDLHSSFNVDSVKLNQRIPSLYNRSSDPLLNYTPSRITCVFFKGQILPKYVFLYMVRYEVQPFLHKVPTCFSCFRLAHVKAQCKGHPRCVHYNESSHGDSVPCFKANLPPMCGNCKGAHIPSCPELKIHKLSR